MLKKNHFFLFLGLMLIGLFSRLIPHVPNVTSVAAISLFAGAILSSRVLAILVPFVMMFGSDLILNNTISRAFFPASEGFIIWEGYMLWVYLGIGITAILGSLFLKQRNVGKLFAASIGATVIFWLLSNIGAWLTMELYPKNAAGLAACYGAAIPFLRNSLLGDLAFTMVLFGIYDYVMSQKPQVQLAK